MHRMTFPVPRLHHYLRELGQHPPGPVRVPVGVRRSAEWIELIAAAPGSEVGRVVLLSWSGTLTVPHTLPLDCAGVVLLGHGPQRGRARGVVRLSTQALAPLHQLRLVGPGMLTVPLQQDRTPEPVARLVNGAHEDAMRRWSRTIGALGLDAWQRLTHLRYAIVDVGRSGSSLALALARLGVRHLTLIDPDRVELHNVGEMLGITDAAVGHLKVEALATALTALAPTRPEIVAVPASITRLHALQAAQDCDVLVACVDHDSARLALSVIATVFCKPLLDLATGVHAHGAARQMGADVRLVLPGRCLLCFGGLRDVAAAQQVLASAEAERAFAAQRDWQQERAGSLASLNQCAVSVALRLLEDWLSARVADSTWTHLEFDPAGRLTVSPPSVPLASDRPSCPLCRLSGWGEEGLTRVVALLHQGALWAEGSQT